MGVRPDARTSGRSTSARLSRKMAAKQTKTEFNGGGIEGNGSIHEEIRGIRAVARAATGPELRARPARSRVAATRQSHGG